MSLRSVLAALQSAPSRPKPRAPRATFRPGFESLEDRRLLSFTPMTSYPVGTEPQAIVAADFNNDGRLDLATANWQSSNVSVLRGSANGTFQPAQTVASGANPVSIAVGDFNNDGTLDLVTGDLGGHSVSVLISNGDGTFQPPISTEVQGGDPVSVAVGDFNKDGRMDVVVGTYSYYWGGATGTQVEVLLGSGRGGFTHGDLESLPYSPKLPLAVADVNRDGRPDVLVASESSMLVSVLLANPDGTLSYTMGSSDFSTGNNTRGVAVGDFTGDGIPDLLAAGYTSVAVLSGRGDGTFAAPMETMSNNSVQTAAAAGDFNRDGRLDVVTTDDREGVLTALLGLGDGTFSLLGDHTVGSSPKAVVAGDFNGDGWLDVATANGDFWLDVPDAVSVLLNDQSWQNAPPPAISISDAPAVTEGNTGSVNATFAVTLSKAAAVDVTVHYSTANLTAVADSDYKAASGTLTIPAGQTSKTFTVAVLGDRLAEPTETFGVNLSSPTNATIGDGQGIGTILDNEPRISINNVGKKEGNGNKTTLFTFTVMLSAAYDEPVTMSFRTVDGTATTANADYLAKTGTLTFAPGETKKTITIEVQRDSKRELHETFYLDLFDNSSNSLFTKSRGIGTILNDD